MRLQILGGLECVAAAGGPVPEIARQTRLLLACLALAGPRGLTRSDLCVLFWPDRPTAQARNSLRQALVAARKALSIATSPPLQSDLGSVKLLTDPERVDVHAFRHGFDRGDREGLVLAANSYRGELLAGAQISEEIEQFVAAHRRLLGDQADAIAERLSKMDDAEALAAAQTLAERLLHSMPCSEGAHRALMRIHHRRGRTNAALQQYNQCKSALQRELQTEPDAETTQLADAIRHTARNENSGIGDKTNGVKSARFDTPHPESAQPSIAVMPFDNLGDVSDEYFADGVVEEITSALSRIRDFFVIARQSAFTFKGQFVDVKKVGLELGVAYLVEGTVRRGGDRLRISVQLVETVSRKQLWSDRYEGSTADIFEFQDRIAAQVAGALKPAVRHAEIEVARRRPPSNLNAYELVMRAFPKLWGQNGAAIGQAIPILQDAIRADPAYGRAHALLSWCRALNVTYLWAKDLEREKQAAKLALEAALCLIDDDPTALTAAGAVTSFCGDHEAASVLVERALALDPNNAWAWSRWGWIGIYRAQSEGVLERFENAIKLSPLDPFGFNTRLGMASFLALSGHPGKAVKIAIDVTQKHPEVTWAHRLLASWAAMAGNMKVARKAARNLLACQPGFTIRRYLAIPAFQDMPEYRDRLVKGLRDAGLPEG